MLQEFTATNESDAHGNPAGGRAYGTGFDIAWQNGPLGRGADRVEPNGAFVETLIQIVIQRIEYYQDAADGRFGCVANADAIVHLNLALKKLQDRTAEREARGVEGTHEK